MRPVQQTRLSGDPILIRDDDLFTSAGISLLLQRRTFTQEEGPPTRGHLDARSGWTVFTRVEPLPSQRRIEDDEHQLFLRLSDQNGLKHLLSPRCLSFMNATILGILRNTRQEWIAAARLQRQDVLYFGDLTRMSFAELVARLGPHGRKADTISDVMTQMGLAFDSSPTWWDRPTRFYERAY